MSLCLLTLSPKPPRCPLPIGCPWRGRSQRRPFWPHQTARSAAARSPESAWPYSLAAGSFRVPWSLFPLEAPRPDPNPSHSLLYAKGPQIYLQPRCFPKPKNDAHNSPLTISPGPSGATPTRPASAQILKSSAPICSGLSQGTALAPRPLLTGGATEPRARGGSELLVSNSCPTWGLWPQGQSGARQL